MKRRWHVFWGATPLLLVCSAFVHAQTAPLTNTVVGTFGNLSSFTVNGSPNAPLTLLRGVTYVFQLNTTSIHPFYIKTTFTAFGDTDEYTNGVTGNGNTSGNLIFAVPQDAPDLLFYHCGSHGSMGGNLNITNSISPPAVKIVFISVTDTNVVILSTGASNWTAIPEFNSNLTTTGWASVPGVNNTFTNGTNISMFNRLDPICGTKVFLRVRNQSQ
jgi:hypothetical protein